MLQRFNHDGKVVSVARYEDLCKHAQSRENELLQHLKLLKSEVNVLRNRQSLNAGSVSLTSRNELSTNLLDQTSFEREQRIVYLRQAFCGFFRAKNSVEMQHLGRVISAILGLSVEEQSMVLEGIVKLAPAVVATSTLESFSQQFSSIFS
jgi:hypothetical protein